MPTSLLERVQEEALSPEAEKHNEKIKQIYDSIFSPETTDAQAAASAAIVMGGTITEERPVTEVADPVPNVQEEQTERMREVASEILFAETPTISPEIMRGPVAGFEYTDRPVSRILQREEEGEDARPTPKTMDTLRRGLPVAKQPEETDVRPAEKVSFWMSLSPRTKAVLSIVALAVFFALALVCINSGIIRSLDADISTKQAKLQALEEQSQEVLSRIEAVTDPAYVDDYAENVLGMQRP